MNPGVVLARIVCVMYVGVIYSKYSASLGLWCMATGRGGCVPRCVCSGQVCSGCVTIQEHVECRNTFGCLCTMKSSAGQVWRGVAGEHVLLAGTQYWEAVGGDSSQLSTAAFCTLRGTRCYTISPFGSSPLGEGESQ
jgi:hypothetical protein